MMCYVEIDGIRVDSRIFKVKFACAYEKCKGACCYESLEDVNLNGGVLTDYDAAEILFHRKALSFLCDNSERQLVEQQPLVKDNGTFYTTLHKGKCVLCNMEKGTCALKIAKEHKIADVDIPLSCHLYPIVLDTHEDFDYLFLENLFDKDYCIHAYKRGEREGIYLIDFLKDALIRGFGEDFYIKLKTIQKEFL